MSSTCLHSPLKSEERKGEAVTTTTPNPSFFGTWRKHKCLSLSPLQTRETPTQQPNFLGPEERERERKNQHNFERICVRGGGDVDCCRDQKRKMEEFVVCAKIGLLLLLLLVRTVVVIPLSRRCICQCFLLPRYRRRHRCSSFSVQLFSGRREWLINTPLSIQGGGVLQHVQVNPIFSHKLLLFIFLLALPFGKGEPPPLPPLQKRERKKRKVSTYQHFLPFEISQKTYRNAF